MNELAYFGMPGGSEILLILFIVLLLFGAKKLPELSRSLGRSLGEFKKGKDDLERELRDMESDLRSGAQAPAKPDEHIKEDADFSADEGKPS